MQSDHDRQWIHTAMSFISAYTEDSSMDLLSDLTDKNAYIKQLMETIIKTASQIDGGNYAFP